MTPPFSPNPRPAPRAFRASPDRRSVALIVTLSFLAILSLMLIAYVSMMGSDRQATANYGRSVGADQLAKGALHLVVGELKREMGKDADPDIGGGTYPGSPVYTNLAVTNIVPQPVGTNAAMPSLVKISTNAFDFKGSRYNGMLMATTNSTATRSLNGRSVGTNRWNQPYLGAFPNPQSVPCWVLVTRGGVTNASAFGASGATANNAVVGNTNYVIGRFAYAVYDEGGLLDINAAGYPSDMTIAQINQVKRTLAGADLTALGMSAAQVQQLIAWRNVKSGATATAFLSNAVFVATNGTGRLYPGDGLFLSRQDLIQAAVNGQAGLTTNVLPYLTTFSREKNAPSWAPVKPTGSTLNYDALALSSAATNALVPIVRHTGSAVTVTNYMPVPGNPAVVLTNVYSIQKGDPAVQRRFPLDCLQWLGTNGPTVSAGAVQARFGLKWTTSADPGMNGANVWIYVGSGTAATNGIATLAQVAAAGREPNFFELLQAGILSGSLGISGGTASPFANAALVQGDRMTQVLRIGASIINQYNTDAYPRIVEYKSSVNNDVWNVAGAVNLPYFNMLTPASTGLSPNDTNPLTQPASVSRLVANYLWLGLWNPTQQGPTAPARPLIQIKIQGGMSMWSAFADQTFARNNPQSSQAWGTGGTIAPTALQLNAAASAGYTSPGMLDPATVATPSVATNNAGNANGWATMPSILCPTAYFAYRFKDMSVTFTNAYTPVAEGPPYAHAWLGNASPFQVDMEYKDAAGKWVPYQYMTGNGDNKTWPALISFYCAPLGTASGGYINVAQDPATPVTMTPLSNTLSNLNSNFASLMATSDPRSMRFNFWIFAKDKASPPPQESDALTNKFSIWPASPMNPSYSATGYGGGASVVQNAPSLFVNGAVTTYFPALLSRNNTVNGAGNTTTAYVDTGDGVARIADSGLFPSTTSAATANPFFRPQDRPIILNRPFNGVGELGYTFRDDPWRSLDFCTSNSADAGLLDLFTMDDSTNAVISGRVSLNTKYPQVLQALLSKTVAAPLVASPQSSDTIGGGDASRLAQLAAAITNVTAATPLMNKAQLATVVSQRISTNLFSSSDEAYLKYQHEAFVRALADVGQTRTWNLMIDLVAQTGRYPSTATGADQFVVEGERRYWLHVAIDRITGQVIDENIEAVSQ